MYIGDTPSDKFYPYFNLEVCNYIEFPYREIISIFYLDQMKDWHSVLPGSTHDSSKYVITLVSFKPNQRNDDDKRKEHAHLLVQGMYKDCFHDVNPNKTCRTHLKMRYEIEKRLENKIVC